MEIYFSDKIKRLSNFLEKPIYAVGGYVRNFLINGSLSQDIDLASPITVEELLPYLEKCDLSVIAEYKRTGTVVFSDGERKYEYTSFREDSEYIGGEHTPIKIKHTEDIYSDALRRDFKCNAIYYDIKGSKIVDPLNGEEDVKKGVLDTVKAPDEVFCHDGLRLMRLARFCAELNFAPTEKVIAGALKNAKNISDVSAERIFAELKMILNSDTKYPFSNPIGHYVGLKILDQTGVLDYIIPELTMGRDMEQRADFHDYDVLEHSLRAVMYAPKEIRLFALLHDIGKPFAYKKDGNFHKHGEYGKEICREVLTRLKADKESVKLGTFLTQAHMIDYNGEMKENKIRLFICENAEYFDYLMKIKQADYSACKDDLSESPSVRKWRNIYDKMRKDNTPISIKELKITGKELTEMGYSGKSLGVELKKLQKECVINPEKNEEKKLIEMAKKDLIWS